MQKPIFIFYSLSPIHSNIQSTSSGVQNSLLQLHFLSANSYTLACFIHICYLKVRIEDEGIADKNTRESVFILTDTDGSKEGGKVKLTNVNQL
jgi:hypothetical protein